MKKQNKKLILFHFLLLFLVKLSLFSQTDSKDFTKNFCLIETNCETLKDANLTAKFINNSGGQVAVISSPNYFVGWIPISIQSNLLGKNKITSITNTKIDATLIDGNNKVIINYFNSVVTKEIFLKTKNRSNDMDYTNSCVDVNEDNVQSRNTESICDPNKSNNSEYMIGSIFCRLFFLESDGSIDTNEYTWTLEDYNDIKTQAIDAWSIWSYTASQNNISVTYIVGDYGFESLENNQPYEPIRHTKTFDRNWINAIMDNVNVPSGTTSQRVNLYNSLQKEIHGTDHSYTTFIAYNPGDAPTYFNNDAENINERQRPAYAKLGGPYTQMAFRINGWSSNQFFKVFGHETGHIFHAFDEYDEHPINCSRSFNGIDNVNYHGSTCNGEIDCIMVDNSFSTINNNRQWNICEYTKSHIGWENLTPSPTLQTPNNGGVFTHNTVLFEWDRNTTNQGIHSYIKILNIDTGEEILCNDLNTNTGAFETLPNGEYEWSITNGNSDVNNGYAMVTSDSWTFTITDPSPDLIVENMWTIPSNPKVGENVDLLVKLKNIGSIPANSISLSYLIDGQVVGTDTHSALDPNDTRIEILHNYVFNSNDTYNYCVNLAPVSNEQNTTNNDSCMNILVANSTSSEDIFMTNASVLTTFVQAGSSITVSINQHYGGSRTVSELPYVYLGYYLSTDCVLSSDDILLGDDSSSIGSDDTYDNEVENLTIPSSIANGTYYIIFAGDYNDGIYENNENNNTACVQIGVGSEDITVNNASVSSSSISAGDLITVSVNQYYSGNRTVSELPFIYIRYFLSTDCVLSSSDILLGDDSSSIGSDDTYDNEVENLTIPSSITNGTYYIIFAGDDNDDINETNENNNTTCVQVNIGSSGEDVTIINESVSSTNLIAGENFTVTSDQYYYGNQTVSDLPYIDLGYYLSTDCNLSSNDILLGDDSSSIGSNDSFDTEVENITIPSSTSNGIYYILFSSDDNNEVSEANENNNVACVQIKIGSEDITLTNVNVSSTSLNAGDLFTVSVDQYYSGNQTVSNLPYIYLGYYLSIDCILTSDDILLGDDSSSIGSDDIYDTETENLTIPTSIDEGVYYIIFSGDNNDDINEVNENNNTICLQINIEPLLPDYIVQNQNINSSSVDVGSEISLSATIKNIGNTNGNNCVMRYFISDNTSWSADDYEFNEFSFLNSLNINETNSININVTIPSNQSVGNKYILFYIDFDNNVEESNENNTVAMPILIKDVKIWEFNQWTNGIPTLTDNAIIKDNFYTISNGNIEAKILEIESGNTLYVNENNYVKVEDNFINNGVITLEPKASFVQVNDDATITGNGQFKTFINTTALEDSFRFTYFSSPSANETLNTFANWGDLSYLWEFNDSTQGWNSLPVSTPMQSGNGYIVRGNTNNTYPNFIGITEFNNAFNNGVITQTLYFHPDGNLVDNLDNDSNLIGNPYPCAIDGVKLLDVTLNPTAGTLYFWTHKSAMTNGDFSIDDYAEWNLSGGTSAMSGGLAPTGFIASGQGFFMDIEGNESLTLGTEVTSTLTFNNGMRVTGNNNDFRRPNNIFNDKVWLNLTNDQGVFNQILVAFLPNTTVQFDRGYDGKRSSNGVASFYSLGSNNQHYGIQALPLLEDDTIVSLGIKIENENISNLTISIDHFESMNNGLENTTIFLKDNLLNIIHDLNQSNYSFNVVGIVENNTRFELLFRNNSLSNEDELFANNSIKVFPNPSNSLVYFEITNSTIIKEIVVYDINGKLINKYTGSHQSIDISKYANGVYLFKIKTNNGSVNRKIMKK